MMRLYKIFSRFDMSIKQEIVNTGKGLINDMEYTLLKLAKMTFDYNEDIRFYSDYTPQLYSTVNPEEVPKQEELPALYVWIDGWFGDSKSMGQQYGYELSQHLQFFVNVKYVCPLIETKEAKEILNHISWALFDDLTKNMNLFDLVTGPSKILDASTVSDDYVIDKKLKTVSSVNIKMVLPYIRKTRFATR
jgi:hypothetical protein